ncbi:hypothetical protein Tco_0869071, partial [Tanacetum coccineum]
MRYIERKRDTRKFLKRSIEEGPYKMKMVPTTDTAVEMPQTEDDLTGDDLKQYEADIEAMSLILLSIPNYIYNSVDACENARDMWDRVNRLIQGTELSKIERESRFLNEFDKFTFEAGESLSSVYNRFSQPEWTKYVTNVRLAKNLANVTYDALFDYLQHSSSSQSLAAYYVTHPPSVVDYDDDYQGDAICDDQEDSLTTTMMLLSRAITQRYSTPTNNRLRTYSNTRNQAIVQADRADIQSKIVGNDGRYARRSSGTQG